MDVFTIEAIVENLNIKPIQFEECLQLWNVLWANRVSPIEPTSAMMLTDKPTRKYSMDIGEPTFLGAFVGNELVGVNSMHYIDGTTRSRGLYVKPEYRGNGTGVELLKRTVDLSADLPCWSYPKKEALNTYLRAGFKQVSDFFWDETEKKWNCYVSS